MYFKVISKDMKSNNKKLDFNLGLNYDIRSETSTTYDYYFNFFPAENVPFFLCYGSKLAFVSIPNDSKIVRFPNYSISNKIVIEKIIDIKDWEMWENNEFCNEAVKKYGLALEFVKNQTEAVCLQAIKQSSFSFKFVKNQTEALCLEAIKDCELFLFWFQIQLKKLF